MCYYLKHTKSIGIVTKGENHETRICETVYKASQIQLAVRPNVSFYRADLKISLK